MSFTARQENLLQLGSSESCPPGVSCGLYLEESRKRGWGHSSCGDPYPKGRGEQDWCVHPDLTMCAWKTILRLHSPSGVVRQGEGKVKEPQAPPQVEFYLEPQYVKQMKTEVLLNLPSLTHYGVQPESSQDCRPKAGNDCPNPASNEPEAQGKGVISRLELEPGLELEALQVWPLES